ncbi:MAG: NADH-quinone oxidoreductase subunit NuoK [Armatimonadota bacterium]|nr:NADH-quinone oxidoreductase subunit NuoK [Armatimonadota bacterium]MDR7438813.1 NADH-quinone oxidoreductase subunit NuoK [Armatimonadota bacterium]MDR7562091.1 NADH-quinone oxidoreductase subunit NuoK [Armatimonadota bacterium]MDR7567891.1 NADH-quinone oxidoreductase subunit NuoK [Armatimonadota bacterium]MDR7601937.1 NADH-quinone oxidoreductase subunit NuoK [Armatimonadota bacterium]
MTVPPSAYVLLSILLFVLGGLGVLLRRTALIVFMSIELMLNSVNLAFLSFARMHGDLSGQLVVFFVLVIAAVEVVVGLAMLIALFRTHRAVDVDEMDLLRG